MNSLKRGNVQHSNLKMASADDRLGGSGDVMYTDDAQQQPLEEFILTYPLPQSVSVAGGSFVSRNATLARGDVLILRNKTPTSITLSFEDQATGARQELAVKPDIPLQFLALTPKDSEQPGHESRPVSIIAYPTVADLLMDCPTYFEATSTYDDPYLPGFSVKPGDRFYYVKVVRDVAGDKMERLQCRTESGELVCLSTRCRGNFIVLKDDTPYTLQQLIDLAKVPRRLQVVLPSDSVTAQGEETFENNMELEVLEKLQNCSGVINMFRPQEMLEMSPWDNPETTWHVPVDSSLHVRLFSATDYEEPVLARPVKPEPVSAFAHEHENEFPVQAAIMSYIQPPDTISQNLHSSREIIVHKQLHTRKLFVKDSKKDEFFAIDKSVDISFVQNPRTLSSVFEMMSLPLGSQVRVLADVAADFPEPFVLRYGDVLCVTKHDSFSWKFKHSSTGDVPIVKCEKLVHGKKAEKLKLPLDLEVSLVLLEDPAQLKVTKLSNIFSGMEEIPAGEVSVVEGNGASYPPLPTSIQIFEVLIDCELLVSPLSSTTAISPLIQSCVRIPVRHKLVLGLKRKLEFPDGYFVLPSDSDTVSLGIEQVQESEYEELVQARKVATEYEEMAFSPRHEAEEDVRSQASSTGRGRYAVNQETVPRSGSSGSLDRRRRKDRIRRLSQALNPKHWHWGRRGKEEEEEENPPPPVSGILTLSLEPSPAVANDYTQEVAQEAGNARLAGRAEEVGSPDDTYEDVNICHPPDRTTPHAGNSKAESRSHPAVGSTSSDPSHSERERTADTPESHARPGPRRRRRKSNPEFKLSEHPTPLSSPGCRRKSPERCRTDAEEDLERAPPVHHTRTRSPDLPESRDRHTRSAGKGQRKKPSSDSVEDKLYQDGASSEDYDNIWGGQRADNVHNPSPDRKKQRPKTENQTTGEHSDSERPRKPELLGAECVRKTQTLGSGKARLPDAGKFRKPRSQDDTTTKHASPDVDKTRRSRSPDRDKTKKPRSPDVDNSRKPRSSDTGEIRKPTSPDGDKTKKPRSLDVEDSRKPRSPHLDQRRNPRSAGSDQSTEQTGWRHCPPEHQSRTHGRPEHASPDSGSAETAERREERKKRERKSPSVDRLLDQPQTATKKAPSPRTNRRFPPSEQLSESVPAPRAERRAPQPRQNKPGKPDSPLGERRTPLLQTAPGKPESGHSPQRPQRPRRKTDVVSDKFMDRSMDSVDSSDWLGSSEVAGKQDTAFARAKPAVLPKPVLPPSPRVSEASATSKPSKNPPPVAPRRKRAERIGSTEAETFGGGSPTPSRPVLGRKRLS